ncbi:MAG: alpha/beta hydrolase [Gammaproteobacteria bacterium]|nr:alpha/beta hydrolase [Gammaproteobacteria bacterium]
MQEINFKSVTTHLGRKIAYTEFGSTTGRPIIYVHDALSSYIEGMYFDKVAKQHSFRLIVIERPGLTYSDCQENRNLSDFTFDVELLMKTLNLSSVGMIGWGGGADYVLTCAYKIPELLDFAVCLSYDNQHSSINSFSNTLTLSTYSLIKYFPKLLPKIFKYTHSKDDQMILNKPFVEEVMLENIKTIAGCPRKGLLEDAQIVSRGLNFNINNIIMPVHFYLSKNTKLTAECEIRKHLYLMAFAKIHVFDDSCLLYPMKNECQKKIFDDISDIYFRKSEIKEIINHAS